MIGKLIGQIVAAPIRIAASLPDVAADVIEEVGKAIDPEPKREDRK